MQSLQFQLLQLFVLAIPVACIAWTVTHEEVFREPRDFCARKSRECKKLYQRKFFYLFTCEYCFSHYITLFMLFITRYQLLLTGWKGYLIAFFSLVWIANLYMSLFGLLRMGIKKEGLEAKVEEKKLEEGDIK
jgi:hypothetical protein